MNVILSRLIAEAEVLAGGEHQCPVLGHVWKSEGGRQCPRTTAEYQPPSSQTFYVCGSCGEEDYGDPGGPGHRDCFINGPCDPQCVPLLPTLSTT